MNYFLFLVNPTLAYDPYPDWRDYEPLIASGIQPRSVWNTGTRRQGMTRGDRGLIVKVGQEPRGLVGLVTITSDIYEGPHWNPDAQRPVTGYVDIEFTDIIDLDDPLSLSDLAILGPGILWTPRQSGTKIPTEVGDRIWDMIVGQPRADL